MSRPAENVVAFYNKRGMCEQCIKEGKGAIKWTRLSCRTFAANAVRLQLHALAYNLDNFLRTLATPEPIRDWSMTSLKEKLIKIGAKVVSHGCLVPGFDGALFSPAWRDALWARFFMEAPRRQRRSVERYNIVKRA